MKHAYTLLALPALAVALTACGSGNANDSGPAKPSQSASATSAPAGSAAAHNDQDVMFAQMMIPHHQQAIQMARLATTRASMPEVRELAKTIEGAQAPEIQTMNGWLRTWGAEMPNDGLDMSHGSMNGMMTEAEMVKLEKLSGHAFDRAFLQMMIKHHQGAVAMANTERQRGGFAAAKTMAAGIVDSQSAEITTMRRLLNM